MSLVCGAWRDGLGVNELNDTVNGSVPFLALDDTVQRAESNRTLG